jgi:hypothetical protein
MKCGEATFAKRRFPWIEHVLIPARLHADWVGTSAACRERWLRQFLSTEKRPVMFFTACS